MSNLPTLRDRLFTSTGAVLNAGKLYFYESGASTTPLDTYSNAGLSVANANPVVADSGGLFGEIYLKLNTAYRVVLKTSADATIYTLDNIYADTLDGTSLSTHFYETTENPNHYGALGTGAADESSYVQSAINAAVANSREGVVDLMGRLYRCDSALTLYSGLTIKNGTLDFSSCTSDSYMLALGTAAASVLLAANVSAGDETATVASTSGISSGDLLYFYDSSGTLNGEIKRVTGTLAAPARVIVASAFDDPYTTANAGAYRKLTTVNDVRLENLVLIANPSAGSGAGRVVHLEMCKDAYISNCRFSGHKGAAIEVRESINVHISDCTIAQTAGSVASAGVNACDASRDIYVTDCEFARQDTAGVDIGNNTVGGCGGVTRNVSVRSCKFDGIGGPAAWAQVQSQYVTINGCHVRGANTDVSAGTTQAAAYGFRLDGYDTTLSNSYVGLVSSVGVYCSLTARATASTNHRLRITGNAILCGAGATEGILVVNDSVTSPDAAGSFVISDNTVASVAWAAASTGIAATNTLNVAISGNSVVDAAASPTMANGILVRAQSMPLAGAAVTGNTVKGIVSTGYGIRIQGDTSTNKVSRVTIAGNSVTSSGYALFLDNYVDGCTVSGNTLEAGAAVAAVVLLTGGAAAGINNVSIAGNAIREGVLGISATNAALVECSGNAFYSQSSAEVSGSVGGGLFKASVSITATEIVGNSAGDLNHANGVTLVAAVAGKIIVPIRVVVNYTYATAAYTGGGAFGVFYGSSSSGSLAGTSNVGSFIFDAAASVIAIIGLGSSGTAAVNTNLIFYAGTAFTQPGTAAGTAVITTYYRLIDA